MRSNSSVKSREETQLITEMRNFYERDYFQTAIEKADILLKQPKIDKKLYLLILILKGKALMRLGKNQEARNLFQEISAYQDILEENPQYSGMLLEFDAEFLILNKQYDEAREKLQKTLNLLDIGSKFYKEAKQRLQAINEYKHTGILSITPPIPLDNVRTFKFKIFFLISFVSFILQVWKIAHFVDPATIWGGSLSPEYYTLYYNALFFGLLFFMSYLVWWLYRTKQSQKKGPKVIDVKEFFGYFSSAMAFYLNFVGAIFLPKDAIATGIIFLLVFVLSCLEKEKSVAKLWFVVSLLSILFQSWNAILLDPLNSITDIFVKWGIYISVFVTAAILLFIFTMFLYKIFENSILIAGYFFTIFSSSFAIYLNLINMLNQNPVIFITVIILFTAFIAAFLIGIWPKLKSRKISRIFEKKIGKE